MVTRSNSARRPWRRALLVGALCVAAAAPLRAQHIVPAAAVNTLATAAERSVAPSAATAPYLIVRASEVSERRVLDRTARGLLIGAGVGLIAAFVHTEITGDYSDHSMDGAAYLVAIPVGALAGSVVGLVVGATGH